MKKLFLVAICELCKKREATVEITQSIRVMGADFSRNMDIDEHPHLVCEFCMDEVCCNHKRLKPNGKGI